MSIQIEQSKIRYRYFRVTETARDSLTLENKQQLHVLTLASYLDGNQIYIGYSINRTSKDLFLSKSKTDVFDKDYGKKRALGRLLSNNPLVINVDRSKPMVRNIIDGLLACPTAVEHVFDPQAVPSSLKNLLKKNIKQYNQA